MSSSTPRRLGALATTVAVAALFGATAVAPAAAQQPAARGDEPSHTTGDASPSTTANGAGPAEVHGTAPSDAGTGGTEDPPAPGNRGTVKIHRTTTPDDDRRHEPKVCEHRIVGFGFPADADLVVSIDGHGGPNAGPDDFTTTVTTSQLSPTGDFAIAGPSLADGMYKLEVENTTAPGGSKQKVFKVDCPGAPVATQEEAAAPGVVASSGDEITDLESGAAVLPEAMSAPAEPVPGEVRVLGEVLTRAVPAASAATANPSAQASFLPRTGSEALRLAVVALALLVAGAAMVLTARRRASSS